jgi:hypothetical protein
MKVQIIIGFHDFNLLDLTVGNLAVSTAQTIPLVIMDVLEQYDAILNGYASNITDICTHALRGDAPLIFKRESGSDLIVQFKLA